MRLIRKVLAIVPVATVIVLVLVTAPAFIFSAQGLDVDNADADVSVDGIYVDVALSADVTSNLIYGLSDLSLSITLFDPSRGSETRVLSSEPVDIPPGETVAISASQRIFHPTLLLMITDLISSDGSILHLRMDADCRYLANMISLHTVTFIDVSLAESGKTVTVDVTENTEDDLSLVIGGLRETLLPDDTVVTVSGDGCTLMINIDVENGKVLLDIQSDGTIEDAITGIGSDISPVVTIDGSIVDVDRETVVNMISLLDAVRGML